jgi:hypothetical protein
MVDAPDIVPLYFGAQAMLQGLDPRDPDVLRQLRLTAEVHMHVGGYHNYYPLGAMALFTSVAWIPWAVFVPLLRVTMWAALVGGAGLAVRATTEGRAAVLAGGLVIGVVFALNVTQMVLGIGQASPLIVLACGVGLWGLATGRHRTAGVAIGLGIALKLFPIVLLLPALAARRWTTAGIAVAVATGVGVIGLALAPGTPFMELTHTQDLVAPSLPDWLEARESGVTVWLWRGRFVALGVPMLAVLAMLAWRPRADLLGPAAACMLAWAGTALAGAALYHNAILLVPALAYALAWPAANRRPLPIIASITLVIGIGVQGTTMWQPGPPTTLHWVPIGWMTGAVCLARFATAWRRPAVGAC